MCEVHSAYFQGTMSISEVEKEVHLSFAFLVSLVLAAVVALVLVLVSLVLEHMLYSHQQIHQLGLHSGRYRYCTDCSSTYQGV